MIRACTRGRTGAGDTAAAAAAAAGSNVAFVGVRVPRSDGVSTG